MHVRAHVYVQKASHSLRCTEREREKVCVCMCVGKCGRAEGQKWGDKDTVAEVWGPTTKTHDGGQSTGTGGEENGTTMPQG